MKLKTALQQPFCKALCLTLLFLLLCLCVGGIHVGSLDDYFIATYTKPATFDTISTYVVNATKGSQTSIKTALWALSTLIFLLMIVIVVVMNVSSGRADKKGERV